ncbi:hypothetical protein FEM48_ZijujUnG0041700 [Ziziphus jujuba var. spinosa]|uniref:Uncharacterized protein n=1 Tax=Ziziphus jujuba var. spinosa TaxID=714518 RepID=A0A978U9B1_ZIZJJ|nr:hypothetical protein FEM48_ZijujUnG0041700 [Ziziphus jujuba var. spinosa]
MKGEWKAVENLCKEDIRRLKQRSQNQVPQIYTAKKLVQLITQEQGCKEYLAVQNDASYTPLHVATLTEARIFMYLDSVCAASYGHSYARRKDGDTFLHAAIAGEHMDLAYQIIDKYGELVGAVNEKGYTTLHILATKPTAFPSGNKLGWLNRYIYHCK